MSDAALAVDPMATRALRNQAGAEVVPMLNPAANPATDSATDSAIGRNSSDRSQLSNYELHEQIGAGGMGTVYKAVHIWLGRTVAVKFISKEALRDPEAIARFAHESLAIGKLDHPNIVRATDAGCAGGSHFLVTEFVDGCDLARLVKNAGRLRTADACEIIRQAAIGLQHAHEQKLVHRDVKPSNLLLSRDGLVKLLDFGLARLASQQTTLTTTGQLIGTLDFLAPEQATDARQVDIRSDIYSLGCTLYFLLTGHAPFSGPAYDTPASKIKGHLTDHPPLPTVGRGRIPLPIVACLERMMAKLPGERYPTPAAVAAALTPHARRANLPALVSFGVGAGSDRKVHFSGEPTGSNILLRLAGSIPAMIGWGLRRIFTRRTTFAGSKKREPIVSIGGLLALIVLGFVFLPHFSCIPHEMRGRSQGGNASDAGIHYFRFGPDPIEHH